MKGRIVSISNTAKLGVNNDILIFLKKIYICHTSI